ncbi:MAG TPA: hypothetical protein DCL61_19905 [Cyanobacteria bacterium UBA12227]|nr:hypothetical protein [Cyanobacteria bacterium UBA12227]HAX85214.1 hypothetical protein [Cyanobacteria bacterium UBA11370]HBY76357.1 hypothetical protein [Cyanobacteria bacterium UBA11148]
MKSVRSLLVALLTAASCLTVGVFNSTLAGTFDSTEVNGDNFIAVAAPFGENRYQLLIIEQLSNQRACWQENGNNPVIVDPLLLNFDFTGICGRSTDSNGYSLRMSGEDLGLDYLLRVEQRNGELVLVGTNRVNRNSPDIEIGRTRGMSNGAFQKIFLDPNWRLTRRTYQGRALGHIYLTTDSTAPLTPAVTTTPQPLPPAATREPLPTEPVRELIFVKPTEEPTVPSVQVPTIEVPATSPQTLPPPPTDRTVPVFGN